MTTRHKQYTRISIRTGLVEKLPFIEEDGQRFNAGSLDGYPTEVALLIVNRWNYLATFHSTPSFLYYLHNAEGAA